jgi:hypothetical protein
VSGDVIRFYTGADLERARLTAAGQLLIGDTSNADIADAGITLRSAAFDQIFAFKDPNVNTGHPVYETDTFGYVAEVQGGGGGLAIVGVAEATPTSALTLQGMYADGGGSTTKSTAGKGVIELNTFELSGGAYGAPDADKNLVVVMAGGTTRFILDADGDSHQDVGTAWTNFDEADDVELLNQLSAQLTRPDDPVRVHFVDWLERSRDPLERLKLVTFNDDGHHFVNWSRVHMLAIGALRQLAQRIAALEATQA